MGMARFASLALTLVMGLPAAGVPASAAAPPASALDAMTQSLVSLLARRQSWIWDAAPGQLRIEDVRSPDDLARLAWVRGPSSEGGAERHAFGLLMRSRADNREYFVDLTAQIDTGYPQYTLAAVQAANQGSLLFVVAAPASAQRPEAALYAFDVAKAAVASDVRALAVTGSLIVVSRDEAGRLVVQVGTSEYASTSSSILEVPESASLDPVGRPARAVTVTTYRWEQGRGAFTAESRPPALTPFGTVEAFIAAVQRGDMRQAVEMTTAEWRRVMGVETGDQFRAYLAATRPHLLASQGPFRFLGGSAGREAASILFSDPDGRMYRVRLRFVPRRDDRVLMVPGDEVPELVGVWQVDGLDGGV